MKVLAIPATNSRNGVNSQVIGYAAKILQETDGVDVELLDLNDYEMPIYSTEREEAGIPQLAHEFLSAIAAADALLISFAEYNGSYTPAWKNTFDWASRAGAGVYQGKPVVMLSASPGPRGGAGVLGAATISAPHLGAELRGSLSISSFYETFDSGTGTLRDADLDVELREVLRSLV